MTTGRGPLRRQLAVELATLAALAAVYLALLPRRPPGLDPAMALLGLALVGLGARRTRERIWGPPAAPAAERHRRAARAMTTLTAAALVGLAVYATWPALATGAGVDEAVLRLAAPRLLAALPVYVPWALVQQALFQFYLLGRLRALLPGAPLMVLATLNGLALGAVHWPDREVAALTALGGAAWSYRYHHDRLLVPLALSHAVLGTAFYGWVRGTDPLGLLLGR